MGLSYVSLLFSLDPSPGHEWEMSISCDPSHSRLDQCTFADTWGTTCLSRISLTCSKTLATPGCASNTAAEFRLVDSLGQRLAGGTRSAECSGTVEGRLEVLRRHNESDIWGSVCGPRVVAMAERACREMGLVGGTLLLSVEEGVGMSWQIEANLSCSYPRHLGECIDASVTTPACAHI